MSQSLTNHPLVRKNEPFYLVGKWLISITLRFNHIPCVSDLALNGFAERGLCRFPTLAECPKVCVIYGLILANHLETLTEFTHEELIVCKALENATDYYLKNFKEIMENYLKPTSNGRRIVFPKDFADIAAFTTTCDWCVYNRIFVSRTAEWGEMEEGILDMSTYYYEANPASVLLDNINAARQTWNYG